MSNHLTPAQAGALLGISRFGVYAALKQGRLPGFKRLGRWMVDAVAVERIAAGAPVTRKAPPDAVPVSVA